MRNNVSRRDLAAGLARSIGPLLILTSSLVWTAIALGEDGVSPEERKHFQERPEAVRLQRSGGGLRIGMWDVQDLKDIEGAEDSRTPAFEGYFQKGIDAHLVLESTFGFWKRSQRVERAGSLGSFATEEIHSYVVPAFSALKLYPFTGPRSSFGPYADAGVGLALGIDDREVTSDGLLGAGTDSGTSFLTGFGFKTGAGLQWMFTKTLGLDASGRYQWIRFSDELGGARTLKGFGIFGGLAYGFQYE